MMSNTVSSGKRRAVPNCRLTTSHQSRTFATAANKVGANGDMADRAPMVVDPGSNGLRECLRHHFFNCKPPAAACRRTLLSRYNLTLGIMGGMEPVSRAASLMGRRSAEARIKQWGKREFIKRMQEWGKMGGRPKDSGKKQITKGGK